VPFVGWVTTTPWSLKILPPPSGMSAVSARAVPPREPDEALAPESLPLAFAPAWVFEEEESDEPSSDPHAVSATAGPAAPTAATTVRRAGAPVG
jgi:hypothetical protein